MTTHTNSENAKRNQVFTFVRNSRFNKPNDVYQKFGKSKVVKNAMQEAYARIEAAKTSKTIREQFIEKLNANASKIAECLPYSGYSMGEFKYVSNAKFHVHGECDCRQYYSKSCRYRETHGDVRIELPVSLIYKIQVLSSMPTILGKNIQNNIWKCQWIKFSCERNKRGIINSTISYHLENGYVASYDRINPNNGETSIYYYHTKTLAEARDGLKRGEKAFKIDMKDWKYRLAAKQRREYERTKSEKAHKMALKKMANNELLSDALNHQYIYRDSIAAGNCVPGTNHFIENNNLDKSSSLSGIELLKIANRTGRASYIIRIIINYLRTSHPEFCTPENEDIAREYIRTL